MGKKTVNCKVCGAEIAKSAKTCPQCGAKVKPPKIAFWALGLSFFVIILCILAVAFADDSNRPNDDKIIYNIGDTCTIGDFEIVVSSFDFSNFMGGDDFPWDKATEGNKYINVIISVTNKGAYAVSTDKLFFSLVYDQEYKYNCRYGNNSNFYLANDKIIPLASLNNKIISFEIPVSIENDSKPIELVISNGIQEIFGGYTYKVEDNITYRFR